MPRPNPAPRPRPNAPLLKVLTVLIVLTGILLTYLLARSGHETAGLVAVLTALVPVLHRLGRERS
ncbi:hypothetical protein [Deinococcus sp.]|uniref:hypothetical protein n=1 Tax=Deinococcus sp. TaxID=47478 RepID=UPI003C7E9306